MSYRRRPHKRRWVRIECKHRPYLSLTRIRQIVRHLERTPG